MPDTFKARTAQYPVVVVKTFEFSDLESAVAKAVLTLPGNAVVIGGELTVNTAWNSATSAALSIGDGASATRYASAVNMKTAARTALTLTGFKTAAPTDVNLTITIVGATSAGKATLALMFVVDGKSSENVL